MKSNLNAYVASEIESFWQERLLRRASIGRVEQLSHVRKKLEVATATHPLCSTFTSFIRELSVSGETMSACIWSTRGLRRRQNPSSSLAGYTLRRCKFTREILHCGSRPHRTNILAVQRGMGGALIRLQLGLLPTRVYFSSEDFESILALRTFGCSTLPSSSTISKSSVVGERSLSSVSTKKARRKQRRVGTTLNHRLQFLSSFTTMPLSLLVMMISNSDSDLWISAICFLKLKR